MGVELVVGLFLAALAANTPIYVLLYRMDKKLSKLSKSARAQASHRCDTLLRVFEGLLSHPLTFSVDTCQFLIILSLFRAR